MGKHCAAVVGGDLVTLVFTKETYYFVYETI